MTEITKQPIYLLLDILEQRFSQYEKSVVRINRFVTKATVRGTISTALS